MALPLSSGHVLAFRRCTASSIGPPFTCVWQRDPQGRWTFHVDVVPDRACPRYFGPALHDVRVGCIDVVWKSRCELSVHVHAVRLHMALRLCASPLTRLITSAFNAVPAPVWRSDAALGVLGRGLGLALGVGRLALSGHVPAGHSFRLRPRAVWRVDAAAVLSDGQDLGEMTRLDEPVALRDFTIPQGPLFAAGASAFVMAHGGSNGEHPS
jgi:hypothetical protein